MLFQRSAAVLFWFIGFSAGLVASSSTRAELVVAQQPLFTLQLVDSGHLVLTPSVEWPTINSVANLGDFNPDRVYVGYFDPRKCYQYRYHATESERHFYPVRTTSNGRCGSAGEWSGNFLNWAVTQTVDPFRKALTGGNRVKDTPSQTWLQKARHDGQGGTGIFPNRRVPASGNNAPLVREHTPFTANFLQIRIQGLGHRMRFRLNATNVDANVQHYNPASSNCASAPCELSVRVAVCVPGLLEDNCKQYASGWKPEGLLQEYADRLEYSLFSYLNDSDILRDGGVMRARKKYIGPKIRNEQGEWVDNPRREWDPVTGVLIRNPDSDWAAATNANIQDSGVINYLNKFGEMTTRNHKSIDPVSELYYTALRYLRNLGNVPEYSILPANQTDRYNLADGFPVITTWDDPITHWCQKNVILGIGDIYSHKDKNLPGSSCTTNEPSKPGQVQNDTGINVVTLTNRVGQMEGIGNVGSSCNFTGRENSAFIAGMAWYANAYDLRPDLPGKVRASTYWIDVLEAQSLEGMARNQYALAAKYGGARLPANFDPNAWGTAPLPESWWHTNGETLTPFGSRGNGQPAFKRPDNFYLAGNAADMVESLKRAFEAIALEVSSSSAAAATSSLILRSDTRVFVAGFRGEDWSGYVAGLSVLNGNIQPRGCSTCWEAEPLLRQKAANDQRRIFTRRATNSSPSGSGNGSELRWNNLHNHQQNALNRNASGTTDNRGQDRILWLRGQEVAGLRSRNGPDGLRLLGAVVNAYPAYHGNVVYVGANDGMLHAFDAETGEELFAYLPGTLLLATNNNAPVSFSIRVILSMEKSLSIVTISMDNGAASWWVRWAREVERFSHSMLLTRIISTKTMCYGNSPIPTWVKESENFRWRAFPMARGLFLQETRTIAAIIRLV